MTLPDALHTAVDPLRPAHQRKTRGELEAAIANAAARFHLQLHGRGPSTIQVRWDRNHICIRSRGIFTCLESRLLTTREGCRIVELMRQEMHRISGPEVEAAIAAIAELEVIGSTMEVDITKAELVEDYELLSQT